MSLVARELEAGGIPTVIMGCARDIVEHCGVPRFLFSDFPLGNSAGRPFDPESQAATLDMALQLLEGAPGPRTTTRSPLEWPADRSWKLNYNDLSGKNADDIARLRQEFEGTKAAANALTD